MRTDLAIIFWEQLCHTHIAIVLLRNKTILDLGWVV